MENIHLVSAEEKKTPLKCFECKHWQAVVQADETAESTYTSIVREKNMSGQILGACMANQAWYPTFDTEECKLKEEYKHLAERVN